MRKKVNWKIMAAAALLLMGTAGMVSADEYPSSSFRLPEVKEKPAEEGTEVTPTPTDKPVPTPTPRPSSDESSSGNKKNKNNSSSQNSSKKDDEKKNETNTDKTEEKTEEKTEDKDKTTTDADSKEETSEGQALLQETIDASYDWEKDENGDLVLDEEGNPVPILKGGQEIPKEYERDEEGELVLDEEGNPIVTFTVPETSVLIESITDALDEDRSIDIYVNWGDQEPALGSVAEFVTVLHGYDRVEYVIHWQHSEDDQNWEMIPGATGTRYRVMATEDNYQDYWRVKVNITGIRK